MVKTSVLTPSRLERQGGRCYYCRMKLLKHESTRDHVVPKSRGGRASDNNIVIACKYCNFNKGSKTVSAYLKSVEFQYALAASRLQDNKKSRLFLSGREVWIEPGKGKGGDLVYYYVAKKIRYRIGRVIEEYKNEEELVIEYTNGRHTIVESRHIFGTMIAENEYTHPSSEWTNTRLGHY
jgi:hypothetical protein